ncbi:helix-turn-helix domain-containing protein [Nocardioides sp. NPDC047086]|uniref:TetR/AcrR family transcriptional regulator n=1 Tax=Nocardioides sp. NPDC047086 TaxID=3154810 RepID=UPI0033D4CE32
MSALSAATVRRARPGRPRHIPETATTKSPREQILEAAVRLFTGKGFAGTSTREIADAVGIRQASLYYHFAGKDEILTELLGMTVRPSHDKVDRIIAATPAEDAEGLATALYLLALVDIGTLAEVPHNIGMLARMPDVVTAANGEVFAGFRLDYREIAAAYADFGGRLSQVNGLVVSADGLATMLIQQVEAVITLRTDGVLGRP